jgi:prepilin-type N-terminal cleavage/methylation domain-containing protein
VKNMHSKNSDFFKKKPQQAGFSLVELLVAMLISLTLIFACTALYSSLKNSINTAQKLATAQESLRGSFYLLSRSVHQANSIAISGANNTNQQLTVGYGEPPGGEEIYGCLGNKMESGSADTYLVDVDTEGEPHLYCDDDGIGIGSAAELIALDVTWLRFQNVTGNNEHGLIVKMKIEGMPEYLGDKKIGELGLSFPLALRQKILLELAEE